MHYSYCELPHNKYNFIFTYFFLACTFFFGKKKYILFTYIYFKGNNKIKNNIILNKKKLNLHISLIFTLFFKTVNSINEHNKYA